MIKPASFTQANRSKVEREPVKTNHIEGDLFYLDDRVVNLLNRFLGGFMVVAIVALIVLLIRVIQYEISVLVSLKIMLCVAGLTLIFFRRFVPVSLTFGVGVFLAVIVCGLGLLEFGLVTPAIVALPVIPIIIGCVYGLKSALISTVAITALIVAVGTFHVVGRSEVTQDLNFYMTQWSNWAIVVFIYFAGVTWAATLAATLTESWKHAIQERKQAEQETLRERELVEKLHRQQSIGQLSAGVAHDFNNILAALTLNLELANSSKDESSTKDFDDAMEAALNATKKGAELTRGLVSFAKVAVLEPKALDINNVIEQSLQWIKRTIPSNISFDLSLDKNLPSIEVDETALSSTLLNLIINSRDAMPHGGIIQLKTGLKTIEKNDPRYNHTDIVAGDYVELSIADSGIGIADSDHERVFEPFYSTKDPGKGSGLGLAMVQGFVKQSGGGVILKSKLGSGTTFSLLFKAHSAQPTVRITTEHLDSSVTESNAALMVVEDEPAILNTVARMLRAAGYTVRTAISGDLAWESLSDDANVDLVLSDVVMPGDLQGNDLAKKIKDTFPLIPVILTSGYPLSFEDDKDRNQADRFLHKPYNKIDLIKAIEITLDKSTIKERHE